MARTFSKNRKRSLKSPQLLDCTVFENIQITNAAEKFECQFCQETIPKTTNDLSLHMLDYHAEHFFLEISVSREKISELQDLSTLLLNSEMGLQNTENLENMVRKYSYPYGCANIQLDDRSIDR